MKLTDFFGPKYKHSRPRVRAAAARKTKDQTILTEIALNDADESVRAAAVENLTDQALLAQVARNDRSALVRQAAVRALTDQALLADAAKNDADNNVRIEAVNRLTNRHVLHPLRADDSAPGVSHAARERLAVLESRVCDYCRRVIDGAPAFRNREGQEFCDRCEGDAQRAEDYKYLSGPS